MKNNISFFFLSSKVDFNNTFPNNDQPFVPKTCDHTFWIPIEKTEDWTSKDKSVNENVVQFLPWEIGYPRGKFILIKTHF